MGVSYTKNDHFGVCNGGNYHHFKGNTHIFHPPIRPWKNLGVFQKTSPKETVQQAFSWSFLELVYFHNYPPWPPRKRRKDTNSTPTLWIWRCISYWRWGIFSNVMLVFRGVFRDGLAGKTRGNCWDVLLVRSSWSIHDNLFISRL